MKRTKRTWPSYVKDSELLTEGRKEAAKLGRPPILKSPLTQQLYATLSHPDGMVRIPLSANRSANATIFNLRQKAKRLKASLGYAVDQESKLIYAWLKRGPKTEV